MFGKIFRFLERQATTKTGQFGMTLIAGAIADQFVSPEVGGVVRNIAGAVFGPETAMLGAGAMFLRDKEAKKEQAERMANGG